MLVEISRLLQGYVSFELKGDSNRFINLAVKKGIVLWGFQKDETGARANVKAGEYRKLWAVKRRCGITMRHTQKHGLVFQTERLRRRKGLMIGAALMIAVYMFLSSFIWDVQVAGNDTLTDAQVLAAASGRGVSAGVLKKSIEPEMTARQLMLDLQDVSWITVNTNGCSVEIRLKELLEKPEYAAGENPANIVANQAGRILSITAESGMTRVKVGDMVESGQVLITGVYTENIDPYVQKQAPIKTFLVAARGEVTAETAHEFVAEVSMYQQEEVVRRERSNSYLNFFGLLVPLGLQATANGEYRVYEENNPLVLLDRAMPVGILNRNYVFYETQEKQLPQEEMRRLALYKLREQQKELLGETAKITEETLSYQFADGTCTLTAVCRCEEKIGISNEISFEYPIS